MIELKSILTKYILVLLLLYPSISLQAQDWKNTRSLRYQPQGEDFVITSGNLKFNRALYGTNTEFRVEAGDLPEFALYLPGMGGNLKLALVRGEKAIWLTEAKHIEARYRPGSMIYNITDPLLGQGRFHLTVLPMNDEEGVIIKAEFQDLDKGVKLLAVYGGASNEVFRRAGERNVDADDCFFLKTNNCIGNEYSIQNNSFSLKFGVNSVIPIGAHLVDKIPTQGRVILGTFPSQSKLMLKDANSASSPLTLMNSADEAKLPVMCAQIDLKQNQTLWFSLHNPQKRQILKEDELIPMFATAEKARTELSSRLVIHTPDPFLNAIGGALSVAGDAIWQDPSYLHGAISWRVRIPGWRASYVADILGWNDRAKTHFSAYAKSQLTAPLSGPVERDTAFNLGRIVKRIGNAMYSSGYVCPDPNSPKLGGLSLYDMNLVYIDGLLRHFYWTGDLSYLKEMWPTIERHLAWEKRTFDADGDGLYDAFACIWASDALYYNGGGVTHSSAYNYFANKCAAQLASFIGKNAVPYQQEADKILKAINARLWIKNLGRYAEFVDAMGLKKLHTSAALWTVYHSIDSGIADQFQEYQTLRYVDNEIPHIPFKVKGMEDENFHVVATTNWMPYYWSINNVAPAEQMHAALAYWQGGRNEEAYRLLKSVVMDNQFCGSSPGNFSMMSVYNAAGHIESYRDFADVIGIASRALVEGLIGIQPDAIDGKMVIRPGLPQKWNFASFQLPYVNFKYKYTTQKSTYSIVQKRPDLVKIILQIPAKTDHIGLVTVNGNAAKYTVLSENVGCPMVEIELPAKAENKLSIAWEGKSINSTPVEISTTPNEKEFVHLNAPILELNDPQGIVVEKKIEGAHLQLSVNGELGARTLFAKVKQGEMSWWQPIHITLKSAIEIISGDAEDGKNLNLYVRNNFGKTVSGVLMAARNTGNVFSMALTIKANSSSNPIAISANYAVAGTNAVEFKTDNGQVYAQKLVNWSLPLSAKAAFEQVNISTVFNDKVAQIFAKNKYLSPRSPYNTLQIPSQGMGEWCGPLRMVALSDSGLRAAANNDVFTTPFGLSFATPNAIKKPNIAFTSLWDNYPDTISIRLDGKASHAYLLMAGSTNHMQSHIENGVVTVKYTDGSQSVLSLVNPETWAPIERDFFTDEFSYKMKKSRPYRVLLKTGQVTRNLEKLIVGEALDARLIDGGGAIILDLPLDKSKELKKLTLTTEANEVVIGMMAVTLDRN